MTRSSISADDDVRRSIDVLDKVLSEFDDIDGFYSSGQSSHESQPSDSETQKDIPPSPPPPIDRSLKPRSSPPTLPKKTKKKVISQQSLQEVPASDRCSNVRQVDELLSPSIASPTSTANTRISQKSRKSEASSHEYQEINCGEENNNGGRESRSFRAAAQNTSAQIRTSSRNRLTRGNSALEPRHTGKLESSMRKSKSGDVSLPSEESQRRNSRRSNARRARSSDRVIDSGVDPFFDPHMHGQRPMDPRLLDPRFVDRRMFDPRFADPRMMDPRFNDPKLMDPLLFDPKMIDPRFLDPSFNDPRLIDPRFIDASFLIDDPRMGRFPMEDPMQFPHLMTLPAGVPGPYSLPPMDPNDYPHTIPRYNEFQSMQDPLMGPDMLMNGALPPLDPHMQGCHPHFKDFNPLLNDFDPNMMSMMPPPPNYPINYPMDMPVPYPMDMPPMNYPLKERHTIEGSRGVSRSRGSRHPDPRNRNRKFSQPNKDWMPPSPDEAKRTIQRVVKTPRNNLKEEGEMRGEINGNQRTARRSLSQSRRLTSTGHSDSSGRSSPLDEANHNARIRGFRVGDPVRKDSEKSKQFENKEVVSMPHFAAGGKDSGFDEAPAAEDRNSSGRTQAPGFVVAGVFSDSSKMYIPAPPSPTPDYDHTAGDDTDGGESDILQEPFYVEQPKEILHQKNNDKATSSSSNRDSLSDDSLQDNVQKVSKKLSGGTNSLQALMNEFHKGLPPVRYYDGSYSDDSLEEEESSAVVPTGPSLQSRRPQSLESLVSMDGSTTSFDYMSDLHSKFPSTSRLNTRSNKEKSRGSFDNDKCKNKQPSLKDNNNKKAIKKSESLPFRPNFKDNKENKNVKSNSSKSSNSSNEENENSSSSNGGKKFNTIRTLIKEGLIEGLDETPPDFKPPPPTLKRLARSSSNLDDRADSGLGSTASTNHRLDESGGSDDLSDKSSPSKTSSERARRTSSPPPLPPPRESSISVSRSSPSTNVLSNEALLSRNQSWLYKSKRQAPLAPTLAQKRDVPDNKTSSNATSSLVTRKKTVELSKKSNTSSSSKKKMNEKVTHVDEISSSMSNGNLAAQYATPLDQKVETLDNSEFIENRKNHQISNFRSLTNDNLSLIYEDQASLSSQGSRSSRFFSRISESMKSNRSSNSSIKNKKNSSSANKFYHGDVIRDPCLNQNNKESIKPLLTPPKFESMVHSSSAVPLTRDGSGRFRSIEDLAAVSDNRRDLDPRGADADIDKKHKKHSTLPPNLTPAEMEKQAKEFSKKGSQVLINRDNDSDGSKFKFNIFKGFWRKNKYSFDKY